MTEDSLTITDVIVSSSRGLMASIIFSGLLILSGCTDNPSVVKYQAPKAPAETVGASMEMPDNGNLPPARKDVSGIEWTVPSSWVDGKVSSMRMASFAIPLASDLSGDVSLVELAGPAGGLMANVNRWRGQVGLADLTLAELKEALEKRTTTSGLPFSTVEMVNEELGSAIVAGIYEKSGATLFAKLSVTQAGLDQSKESFYTFCESIRFTDAEKMTTAPTKASPQIMDPSLVPPADLDRSGISWTVPSGWSDGKASSMRLASFAVSHTDGSVGDLSVVKLTGTAGGVLANVNRWRGQVGLAALNSDQLKENLSERATSDGVGYFAVEMFNENSGAAIHAGIFEFGNSTLFVKLNTNKLGLGESRGNFYEYCDSLTFAKQ